MNLPPLLIFDIDGVLIDVRNSYRVAAIKTAQFYLQSCLGLPISDALISTEDVAAFKTMGGFNNDWDLTAGLLSYFLAQLPSMHASVFVPATLDDALNFLFQAGQALRDTGTLATFSPPPPAQFVDAVRQAGGGLPGLQHVIGTRNHALLFYEGTLENTNLVLRLFQEIYLGPALFTQLHGVEPRFHHTAGLIDDETALIAPNELAQLATRAQLGIASGRPRAEAIYGLARLGLASFFKVVITHDETVAEEARRAHAGDASRLGKPHPWTLLTAADTLDPTGQLPAAYFGDTTDDIRAAQRANATRPFVAVGVSAVGGPTLHAQLQAAGATLVVEQFSELLATQTLGKNHA